VSVQPIRRIADDRLIPRERGSAERAGQALPVGLPAKPVAYVERDDPAKRLHGTAHTEAEEAPVSEHHETGD